VNVTSPTSDSDDAYWQRPDPAADSLGRSDQTQPPTDGHPAQGSHQAQDDHSAQPGYPAQGGYQAQSDHTAQPGYSAYGDHTPQPGYSAQDDRLFQPGGHPWPSADPLGGPASSPSAFGPPGPGGDPFGRVEFGGRNAVPETGYAGPPRSDPPAPGWRPPTIAHPPPPRTMPGQDIDALEEAEGSARTVTYGVGLVAGAVGIILVCLLCARVFF
jgi:hypothetical protein